MQAERIALRRLESGRLYCEELGIIIEQEATDGAHDPARIMWAMAAGDVFVYAGRLAECRRFLEAVLVRARGRVATGRTKREARLARVGRGRWRTDDGIEVWCERRSLAGGSAKFASFRVDLSPSDPAVPAVEVGASLEAARRLIAALPWRGAVEEER